MRKQLHPGCSCFMCRLGRRHKGPSIQRETSRRLRTSARTALKAIAKGTREIDAEVPTIISGGYTD